MRRAYWSISNVIKGYNKGSEIDDLGWGYYACHYGAVSLYVSTVRRRCISEAYTNISA
jgi:hypothetical protein